MHWAGLVGWLVVGRWESGKIGKMWAVFFHVSGVSSSDNVRSEEGDEHEHLSERPDVRGGGVVCVRVLYSVGGERIPESPSTNQERLSDLYIDLRGPVTWAAHRIV